MFIGYKPCVFTVFAVEPTLPLIVIVLAQITIVLALLTFKKKVSVIFFFFNKGIGLLGEVSQPIR